MPAQLEIAPQPTPQERAALEVALRSVASPMARLDRGEWWRRGVQESVLGEEDPGSYEA